ncbi:MAG: hydrogenase maturation protease [Candidatus Thermoplasmatota archaeon]|nr:hydrogenase maturation protease [Candidatus Thermoplasmatota archaeon]
MKTIILGVGNPILRDDGVGVHVSRQLKQRITDPNVTIDEAYTGGMNLLDMILGYDKAILIDAVNIINATNGEVRRFPLRDASSSHSYNPHDVSLQEALSLAEKLGECRIPRDIVVIGIVVKKMPLQFGEHLSKAIAGAVPKAMNMTLEELENNRNISR